jgi:hypothetical protein
MRSDRLKQVMQEIDPDFDEKELGHPKFSRFCLEAAQRGLLSVTKLENGQLEVDLPREKAAAAAPAPRARTEAAPAPARDAAEGDAEDRGRSRGRRGRGRGRDRGERPPRPDTESRGQVDPNMDTAEMPIPDAEVHEASTDGGRPPRDERPAREARPPRDAGRPAAPPSPRVDAAAASGGDIGVSGERLTREEAFGLVRRAVEAMTSSPEDVVRASDVRVRARELLGRDSQTLAEHFFGRILRDAHDADVIDLRRRGDDFEVARAAEAAPVSEQLSRSAPPPSSATATSPAGPPRGMGPRGGGPTRGGRGSFGAKVGAPPPDLLSIGVVDIAPSTPSRESVESREPVPVPLIEPTPPSVVDAETEEAETPAAPAAAKRGTRAKTAGGRAAKKSAAKTAAPPAEDKPRRARAKKTARTSDG